ncbi:MAG: hypothetical protein IJA37_02935 [Alistipes sp.]|nr:hypothetical protein [Alistipes sp.]
MVASAASDAADAAPIRLVIENPAKAERRAVVGLGADVGVGAGAGAGAGVGAGAGAGAGLSATISAALSTVFSTAGAGATRWGSVAFGAGADAPPTAVATGVNEVGRSGRG